MEAIFSIDGYKCQHQNEAGECTTEYEGYGCIRDRCHLYGTMMVRPGQDLKLCSHKQDDYCGKFKRFHCPGPDNCHSFRL